MAIDTRSKRSSVLRFGSIHLAGTRPPSGSIPAFERAALLACYWFETTTTIFGTPKKGWRFEEQELVWKFKKRKGRTV